MNDGTLRLSLPRALVLLAATLALAACDSAEGPSLFDPIEDGTYQSRPNPTLTGISPSPRQALAGVSTLTLTGTGFAPSADSTFVYFNGKRADVLSATATQITVRAPNMPRPRELDEIDPDSMDLRVKVSVLRAEDFSESLGYTLLPAVERADADIGRNDDPRAVATDDSDNVYYGRRTFTPAGSSPSGAVRVGAGGADVFNSTAQPFTDLEVFAGDLLAVRGVGAIFTLPEGGDRAPATYIMSQLGAAGLNPLALDSEGDVLWAAGVGSAVVLRIADGAGETTEIGSTEPVEVVDLEEHDGYLYLAATFGPASADVRPSRILRYPLSGGRIAGASEVFFDVSAAYPTLRATSIAFGADGSLFLGMRTASALVDDEADNTVPLVRVVPGGSSSEVFFDGLMQGITYGIEWLGEGSTILVVSGPRIVADAVSLGRRADLLFVNTLVEGER
jgi:hypothetical protein